MVLLDIDEILTGFWVFFHLALQIYLHCLMAYRVSTEKSDVILTEDPLSMRIPCCFQNFIFVFQQFNHNVSLWVSLCSGITELLGCVGSCILSNLGSLRLLLVQIYFLPFSLFSFWKSYNIYVGMLRLWSFFFNLFSFFSSGWVI